MKLSWDGVVNILFLFAGKYIKGYRTVIVAVFTFIIGAWEWITGSGLFAFLCASSEQIQAFAVFCNITEGKFYGTVLTVIAVMFAILRKLQEPQPSALTVKKKPLAWFWPVVLGLVGFAMVFTLILLAINAI